jgi:hypothetical protein
MIKKLVMAIATSVLVTGCYVSDASYDLAIDQIGLELFNDHIYDTYHGKVYVPVPADGAPPHLYVIDSMVEYEIVDQCKSLLQAQIEKSDIESGSRVASRDSKLKDDVSVDTKSYNECIEKQLNTLKIEDDSLDQLIANAEFQTYKNTPEFKTLLVEVKPDGEITLAEGLKILDLLRNKAEDAEKLRRKTNIENL